MPCRYQLPLLPTKSWCCGHARRVPAALDALATAGAVASIAQSVMMSDELLLLPAMQALTQMAQRPSLAVFEMERCGMDTTLLDRIAKAPVWAQPEGGGPPVALDPAALQLQCCYLDLYTAMCGCLAMIAEHAVQDGAFDMLRVLLPDTTLQDAHLAGGERGRLMARPAASAACATVCAALRPILRGYARRKSYQLYPDILDRHDACCCAVTVAGWLVGVLLVSRRMSSSVPYAQPLAAAPAAGTPDDASTSAPDLSAPPHKAATPGVVGKALRLLAVIGAWAPCSDVIAGNLLISPFVNILLSLFWAPPPPASAEPSADEAAAAAAAAEAAKKGKDKGKSKEVGGIACGVMYVLCSVLAATLAWLRSSVPKYANEGCRADQRTCQAFRAGGRVKRDSPGRSLRLRSGWCLLLLQEAEGP